MMKFFIRVCQEISTRKGRYLEIGPGHGEYFVTAIQNTTFDYYCAVDISETSVNITKDFCDFSLPGYNGLVEILKADFFEFNCEDKFDAIVMGEVLEHVENPYQFLKKIYDIANEGAYIYISTAVNAPQPDHIYHFKNLDEVYFLLNKARLKIKNQVLIPANANSLDKAIKKGYAIVVGLALEKL
jgi:2-polyprenyl-3-methyl-5-hydroxy-6-metoxy-1,4-benzoquinol methylase